MRKLVAHFFDESSKNPIKFMHVCVVSPDGHKFSLERAPDQNTICSGMYLFEFPGIGSVQEAAVIRGHSGDERYDHCL